MKGQHPRKPSWESVGTVRVNHVLVRVSGVPALTTLGRLLVPRRANRRGGPHIWRPGQHHQIAGSPQSPTYQAPPGKPGSGAGNDSRYGNNGGDSLGCER